MKKYLIDLSAGFLAGFLIAFAATLIGFLGSQISFWLSLAILDVIVFFAYMKLPFFELKKSGVLVLRHPFASFAVFTAGVALSCLIFAYYIVYLLEHSPALFF